MVRVRSVEESEGVGRLFVGRSGSVGGVVVGGEEQV